MAETDELVSGKLEWSSEIDIMLAEWCDQAKCFEWMHTTAHKEFERKARIIVITSNILTAVSGLSNVIAGGSSINGFQLAWVFGSLSIFVSITNMLQEKLAYATSAVEHRQYAISWGIIRRKIEEELVIPQVARKDCKTFLKYLRQDVNQVSMDGSTKIPTSIKEKCYEKFSKIQNFDLPEICGEMEHTKVYISQKTPLLS
jgi:hypothetical protein